MFREVAVPDQFRAEIARIMACRSEDELAALDEVLEPPPRPLSEAAGSRTRDGDRRPAGTTEVHAPSHREPDRRRLLPI